MTDKQLPRNIDESPQLNLFGQFLSNNQSKVSNAIEIWESIPKYFLNHKQVEKLRTKTGHADPVKWDFTYNSKPCMVTIQPALIEQEDGTYKAFFPSATEELVEESLKKILSYQSHGIHNNKNLETWVKFSLNMISKELKERGKTRNHYEIKHAISVMSRCNITLHIDKQEIWSGAILQDLITIDRKKYLIDSDQKHAAKLPLFISKSINTVEYRQFNYDRLMRCNEQLTRWIYKRLINKYTQASLMNDYHFTFVDLKNSGLLQQARDVDNRRKVIRALEELKSRDVISYYEIKEKKQGRKIIDVVYNVTSSSTFADEQKASNARLKNQRLPVYEY